MMYSAFQVVVNQLSLYSTSGMKVTVILLHEYARPCMVPILKMTHHAHLVTQLLPLEYYQCILYKYNTQVTRFIWGPQEILAGEGPAVREARVWRHAVVQVGTQ